MKTRTGVLIIQSDGIEEMLPKTDQKIALSNVFNSVFTKEPDTDIPKLEKKVVDSQLEDIKLSKKDVVKKLMKLKIDKSPGPDAMHPRLLKETAEQLVTALEIIYNSTV